MKIFIKEMLQENINGGQGAQPLASLPLEMREMQAEAEEATAPCTVLLEQDSTFLGKDTDVRT